MNFTLPRVLLFALPVLLTGCRAWERTYDPMPLSEMPILEDGAPIAGAECDSCSDGPAWKRYTLWGRIRYAATCGSGCGEWYWGEWLYDPPPAKGCDKCDMDGNYVGAQPCNDCRSWFPWLRGFRDGSGCPSCGQPGEHDCAVPIPEEEWEPVPQEPAQRTD